MSRPRGSCTLCLGEGHRWTCPPGKARRVKTSCVVCGGTGRSSHRGPPPRHGVAVVELLDELSALPWETLRDLSVPTLEALASRLTERIHAPRPTPVESPPGDERPVLLAGGHALGAGPDVDRLTSLLWSVRAAEATARARDLRELPPHLQLSQRAKAAK